MCQCSVEQLPFMVVQWSVLQIKPDLVFAVKMGLCERSCQASCGKHSKKFLTSPMETADAAQDRILQELDFDTYGDQELVALSNELDRKLEVLQSENAMFESFLGRVGKDGMEKLDTAAQMEADINAAKERDTRRDKKKKGEKQKEQDKPLLLTLEQKSDVATREYEELRDEIQRKKEEWAMLMDNCRAELEENEIKLSEIKKAMYEFNRDITQQAINPRTGRVMAERLVRYFEDKNRARDAIIEKLRLKNVTLKVHKQKLFLQLKQKEEMGEVLHAIDFDQLQIENKQYLQKIEERNTEMLKLKLTTGNTVQVLNQHKKRLAVISAESLKLQTDIKTRTDLLAKLEAEQEIVKAETEKAQKLSNWLIEQIDMYKAPNVLSYVHAKASQHELHKKVQGWNRKVEIASMKAQRFNVD